MALGILHQEESTQQHNKSCPSVESPRTQGTRPLLVWRLCCPLLAIIVIVNDIVIFVIVGFLSILFVMAFCYVFCTNHGHRLEV